MNKLTAVEGQLQKGKLVVRVRHRVECLSAQKRTMEVDGVMMPRPRIPEGPPSPGWSPPSLSPPKPGLEGWPAHLELLEVEELAELLASKDGAVPPALLGAVCSRIEALTGVKAPARLQQRRVYTHDWLAGHSEWTPPSQALHSALHSRAPVPSLLTGSRRGRASRAPRPGLHGGSRRRRTSLATERLAHQRLATSKRHSQIRRQTSSRAIAAG